MISNLGEIILKALAPSWGGMTTRGLSLTVRIKESTVGRGLLRLREGGYVTKVDNLWRCTESGLRLTDGMTFTMDELDCGESL